MNFAEELSQKYDELTAKSTVFPTWSLYIVLVISFLLLTVSRFFGILTALMLIAITKRQATKEGYLEGYNDALDGGILIDDVE